MTTATDTTIDPALAEQARPPCEIHCCCGGQYCHQGERPADWIVSTYVNAERTHTMLMCDDHLIYARAVAADIVTVTAERI